MNDIRWLADMARNDEQYTSGRIKKLEHEKRAAEIEAAYPAVAYPAVSGGDGS